MMLQDATFVPRFVSELPGDPETSNYCRQVLKACYSFVEPKAVRKPSLVGYSSEMARTLGLTDDECRTDGFLQVVSGTMLLPGLRPYALCYGGHQFGHWAGQLGDGRAINLAEMIDAYGTVQTLQLKGCGPTPYSRRGDGFAVLRSSLREFLCSEAMFHLGIPTTRALSLVLTGEDVIRDMLYDGHPQAEPGAIVCRVAPSFVRFGSFELFAARKDYDSLRTLANFTLTHDFPQLGPPSPASYIAWFHEVCRRTARLISQWQRVGFVHGVMNTDNMSILGITIDYGPYGWLEGYDPLWTPNTTDAAARRYCFRNQPQIGLWNLARLADALHPLIQQIEPLEAGLELYQSELDIGLKHNIASKLGLDVFRTQKNEQLYAQLLDIFATTEIDMTIFFRNLSRISRHMNASDDAALLAPLYEAWYYPEHLDGEGKNRMLAWLGSYLKRIQEDGVTDEERRTRMNAVNPKYIFRNYLAQIAIDKVTLGDYRIFQELIDMLRRPYDEQPQYEHYFSKRPEWARDRIGCSTLSCSS